MNSQAPSYYVSSTATPGTGTGALGSPYALEDLSIVGGSYKTVASQDRVALLADGTYTLPANVNLPAGNISAYPTLLRGCKTDGNWDETRATLATVSCANTYSVQQTNTYAAFADIHFTDVSSSTGYFVTGANAAADNIFLYNLRGTKGSGTGSWGLASSSSGMNWWVLLGCANYAGNNMFAPGGSDSFMLYCLSDGGRALNATGPRIHAIHCACRNAGGGASFQIAAADSTILHCTADGDTASTGAMFVASANSVRSKLIGNLAVNGGAYAYQIADEQTLCVGNAYYQCTQGGLTGSGTLIGDGVTALSALTMTDFVVSAHTTLPTLGELLQIVSSGKNLAGALTQHGTGGSGGGLWGLIR